MGYPFVHQLISMVRRKNPPSLKNGFEKLKKEFSVRISKINFHPTESPPHTYSGGGGASSRLSPPPKHKKPTNATKTGTVPTQPPCTWPPPAPRHEKRAEQRGCGARIGRRPATRDGRSPAAAPARSSPAGRRAAVPTPPRGRHERGKRAAAPAPRGPGRQTRRGMCHPKRRRSVGHPPPPARPEGTDCAWAQDAASAQAQKEVRVVSGLKDPRLLSVTRETWRCHWTGHGHGAQRSVKDRRQAVTIGYHRLPSVTTRSADFTDHNGVHRPQESVNPPPPPHNPKTR